MVLGAIIGSLTNSSSPTTHTTTPQTASTKEPDEPCRVEAPPAARAAAQNWCEGGVFTEVNVKNDARNFVVLLQFSKKGQAAWSDNKFGILNRFRGITDEMVEKTDLNVAFSFHGTDGEMLGGCARKAGDRESTCNSR